MLRPHLSYNYIYAKFTKTRRDLMTYHLAVAVIARSSRGRVIERELVRLQTEEHYAQFKRMVYQKFVGYEIHTVNVKEASPPEGKREPGKLWCPYCSSWNKFFDEDGYTKCEICCISTRDFYTVKYNKQYGAVSDGKVAKTDSNKTEQRKLRREKRKKKAK